MPQNATPINVAVQAGVQKPLNLDANGDLKVALAAAVDPTVPTSTVYSKPVAAADPTVPTNTVYAENGVSSALNVVADALVKATPGRLVRVSVLVAGAVGAVHDCAAIVDAAAGNKIGVIPAVVGTYVFDWPCALGIVYKVGAAQVVSISYT